MDTAEVGGDDILLNLLMLRLISHCGGKMTESMAE
jgi:hypothetical protein